MSKDTSSRDGTKAEARQENERIGYGSMRLGVRGMIHRRLSPFFLSSSGQAVVEYAVAASILTATVLILAIFLYTFREYGNRVLDLVSADYP